MPGTENGSSDASGGSSSGFSTEPESTDGGSTSPSENGGSSFDVPLEPRELDRLQDIVALAPTSNGELADQWDYESGSGVYRYLSSELDEYYTRDAEKYIVPTESGQEIVEKVS